MSRPSLNRFCELPLDVLSHLILCHKTIIVIIININIIAVVNPSILHPLYLSDEEKEASMERPPFSHLKKHVSTSVEEQISDEIHQITKR